MKILVPSDCLFCLKWEAVGPRGHCINKYFKMTLWVQCVQRVIKVDGAH